jgi:uncharacterized protein
VNPLKDYIIQFSSLAEGIHSFEFIIDDKFFKEFEFSEITDGKVNIDLQFDRQATMIVMEFAINGYITCICDRCLENYQQEISGNERIIVKFSDDKSEESDEIKVLPVAANEIDISQDVYEFINLLLPVKRVHPEDKSGKSFCNPEIIKILNKLGPQKNIDPRWEELKKISFKN